MFSIKGHRDFPSSPVNLDSSLGMQRGACPIIGWGTKLNLPRCTARKYIMIIIKWSPKSSRKNNLKDVSAPHAIPSQNQQQRLKIGQNKTKKLLGSVQLTNILERTRKTKKKLTKMIQESFPTLKSINVRTESA